MEHQKLNDDLKYIIININKVDKNNYEKYQLQIKVPEQLDSTSSF